MQGNPRIIDEQGNAPMPDTDFLRERPHGRLVGNIHHVPGNERALRLQRLRRLQKPRLIDVRKCQRRARRGQLLRQGAADTGPRTSHNRHSLTQK